MTETPAPEEAPQTTPASTFDISTIQNPFARKEAEEPAPAEAPVIPDAPVIPVDQAPVAPAPAAPAPVAAAPMAAAVVQPVAAAPAGGAIDNKTITDTISKAVEEFKAKGANIDFRSYNIGTVTSISITIR